MFSSRRRRRSRASARGSRRASIPSASSIRAGCTATSEIGAAMSAGRRRTLAAGGRDRFWSRSLLGCQQPQPTYDVERSRSYQQDKAEVWNRILQFLQAQRHHGPAERPRGRHDRGATRELPGRRLGGVRARHRRPTEAATRRVRGARGNGWIARSRSTIAVREAAGANAGDARCDTSPSGRSIPVRNLPFDAALPLQGRAREGAARRDLSTSPACPAMPQARFKALPPTGRLC